MPTPAATSRLSWRIRQSLLWPLFLRCCVTVYALIHVFLRRVQILATATCSFSLFLSLSFPHLARPPSH